MILDIFAGLLLAMAVFRYPVSIHTGLYLGELTGVYTDF
jgi:hypothetical protein